MPFYRHSFYRLHFFTALAFTVGCSGKPTGVEAPKIKPAAAVSALLTRYDEGGDGELSKAELSGCPALRDAMGRYDDNGDSKISGEELAKRFTGWLEGGLGVSSLACRVTLKGRPLEGAEIRFIPDACFEDTLQPATGITDDSGVAMLSIDASHLPADAQNMQGVQQGLYRVEISHPTVPIPGKYNVDTELGKEVSFELGENVMRFSL